MTKRRPNTPCSANPAKTDRKNISACPASVETKWPEKDIARRGGTMSNPAKTTAVQKRLLALAVALEIGWVVFLVVLAAMK
ncbi:MAG: hypothetical protein ABSA26_08300 [Thermoguttaceae bacterium]|jgi:hypothetical protein